MASLVAWLDYSDDDRRRMREVIALFRESDTLDELGIGAIRGRQHVTRATLIP